MEKISGILPSNARITTVDLKNSGSVRGGMPSFGREIGVTAAAQKQIAAQKEVSDVAQFQHQEQMALRNKSLDPRAKIVQEMSDKFFMNQSIRNEQAKEDIDKIELMHPDSYDMKIDVTKEAAGSKETLQNEDEAAVGSYLDVQA